VDQAFMASRILDRILSAWLWEYALVFGFPAGLFGEHRTLPVHQWFWDGMEHVDPAKEATAQATRLANFTTTLAHEYARQGKDWETELRQRAREKSLMNELGLTMAEAAPAVPAEERDEDE
jgi:capsid protein